MPADLETAFRQEWPRVLAALIRYTGSVELAEDAVAEAIVRALETRDRGVVVNPAAWLTTVAKRVAIDAVRRDAALRERYPLLASDPGPDPGRGLADAPGGDDRVGLLLLACAPELPEATRIALALRFACGVRTEAIADALLVDHTAMSARLTRAKARIEQGGVVFPDVPAAVAGLEERLDAVLSVVYLLYTAGHTVVAGGALQARDVTGTAIELARALHRLRPGDPEIAGLLALLLLTEARAEGRLDAAGGVVTIEEADRSSWDRDLIREGLALATRSLPGGGRFALQAGIAGLHAQAPSFPRTDWAAIARLYDRLIERWPSPAAALARTVARSYVRGPEAALAELAALDLPPAIARQAVAVRADLLRRADRPAEARAEYRRASALERNGPIRDFYARRIRQLEEAVAAEPPSDALPAVGKGRKRRLDGPVR